MRREKIERRISDFERDADNRRLWWRLGFSVSNKVLRLLLDSADVAGRARSVAEPVEPHGSLW